MARRSPLLLAGVAALAAFLAPAPGAAGRVPVQSFDLARGLAGDKVWDVELDAAGALWIATTTGVSRFDGVRFRTFDARHGLPHSNVLRLLRLPDGRVAAATGAGVALIDPGAPAGERPWRVLPAEVERGGGQIVALALDEAGGVWAGGGRGLFRIEGARGAERLVAQATPDGANGARSLATGPAGVVWASFETGLHRRDSSGAWTGPWTLPPALDDVAGITDLWMEPSGALWVASRAAVCAFGADLTRGEPGELAAAPSLPLATARPPASPNRAVCVTVAGGLPATRSRRMLEPLSNGRMRITGADGLVEAGPAGFALLLTRVEAGNATFQATCEAPDGTLWIGTGERGLLRLPRTGLELFGPPEGLAGGVSTLLVQGGEVGLVLDYLDAGRRWLAVEGEELVDRTPPDARALVPTWGWGPVSALGPDGAWWAARSGGLVRFPRLPGGRFGPGEPAPPALARTLAGEEPFRLHFAPDGALWVASHQPPALHRADLATGRVDSFPEVGALASGVPTAVARLDAVTWVGFFNGGLARQRGSGRFEAVAGSESVARGFVYALRADRRGRLWVAAGGGLVVCREPAADDPRCERAMPQGELDHLQVFGTAEDALGRLAVATSKGLHLVDLDSGRVDVVTTADGLPGNNLTAIEPDGNGALWIAADRGLARFLPARPAGEPAPARVVALDVAGRPWPVPLGGVARLPRIELAPDERVIEIEVASTYLGSGPPPAYQWRIGGAPWTPPSTERRLRLGGFADGDLTVEARAVTAAGEPGGAIARVDLSALPPLWRRAWFLGTLGLAAAAGLALVYRSRVARLLALERVRTRIAADLHDDLGSSLSRISILAEVARRQAVAAPEALPTLATIGESARELAEMASDIVWAIDPQRDDLASWAARLRRFGEDLFAPAGVAFELAVPDDAAAIRLPAGARRDLYLLAKEALNNAAKYAGAGRVRVSAARGGGRLEVVVEDDGAGFDAAAAAAAEARGGGHGLRTMRDRARRLGGELAVDSRAPGGTRIAVTLPL